MKHVCPFLMSVVASLALALGAAAQSNVPFYYGGVAAFEPEIRVVNSGVIVDAQAVVSQDRKYVTINAQMTNTRLLALQSYNTQTGATHFGYVGGAQLSAMARPQFPAGARQTQALLPSRPSILTVAGMHRLGK
jgi:hypothetical protein